MQKCMSWVACTMFGLQTWADSFKGLPFRLLYEQWFQNVFKRSNDENADKEITRERSEAYVNYVLVKFTTGKRAV